MLANYSIRLELVPPGTNRFFVRLNSASVELGAVMEYISSLRRADESASMSGRNSIQRKILMNDNEDAFDLWWGWAKKPRESMLMIHGDMLSPQTRSSESQRGPPRCSESTTDRTVHQMSVYCAANCDTEVSSDVEDIGCDRTVSPRADRLPVPRGDCSYIDKSDVRAQLCHRHHRSRTQHQRPTRSTCAPFVRRGLVPASHLPNQSELRSG
jgi:hypothetical protein